MLYRPNWGISGLALTISLLAIPTLPACANTEKTTPGALVKYLNPVQKRGYRNESQDRVIKKKAFRVDKLSYAQAVTNKELGFFVSLPLDKLADTAFQEKLLANDEFNGLSVLVPWQLLEPKEDEYNWRPIDQLLSLCEQHHKSLILRVATCGTDTDNTLADSDTPKWVFDAGVKYATYVANGKPYKMPIFWDQTYLASWGEFIARLAEKYDNNPNLHSVGITGGGFAGGTSLLPTYPPDTALESAGDTHASWTDILKNKYGMTPRQLTEHWKYVADIFPKRFKTTRLNFGINAPLPGRAAEDLLDQIADYLVLRYGERIYLTRDNVKNDKHGFDDYRLLVKFRNDTLTGLKLTEAVQPAHLEKISRCGLNDGISFAELPAGLALSDNKAVHESLANLLKHIGYQVVVQKTVLPNQVVSGQELPVSFSFINAGAACPMRPSRQLDKDVPSSYKVQLELRNNDGQSVAQLLHTPDTPTNKWLPGQQISWTKGLKMPEAGRIAPGEYTVWLSLIDPDSKRPIQLLNAITAPASPTPAIAIEVGKLNVVVKSVNQTDSSQQRPQSAAVSASE